MATIASVTVDLVARTAKFVKGLNRSSRALRSFRKTARRVRSSIASLGRTFAKFGAIGIAAGGAGLLLLLRRTAKTADALAKTADKLGITTQALGAFQLAGELGGVSVEGVNKALQNMIRRVSEAAAGQGEYVETFKDLNVNVARLNKLSPDKMFERLTEAIGRLQLNSDKVRASFEIFGRQGVGLLNVMRSGVKGLRAVAKEAKDLGLLFTRLDLRKIEIMNDSITKVKATFVALGTALNVRIAPIITAINDKFLAWVKRMGGVKGALEDLQRRFVKRLRMIADVFDFVGLAVKRLFSVIKEQVLLATAFLAKRAASVARVFGKKDIAEILGSLSFEFKQLAFIEKKFTRPRIEFNFFSRQLENAIKFFKDLDKAATDAARRGLADIIKSRLGLFEVEDAAKGIVESLKGTPSSPAAQLIPALARGSQAAIRAAQFRSPNIIGQVINTAVRKIGEFFRNQNNVIRATRAGQIFRIVAF